MLYFAMNKQRSYQSSLCQVNCRFACGSISPAMAFSPAQDHEIELPIAPINQVPRVPAREDNLLKEQGDVWHIMSPCCCHTEG